MKRWTRSALTLALLITCVGCSRFDADWKALEGVETEGITGRWVGRWESKTSGHSGDLKAIVTRIDERTYETWYKATWGKALTNDYRVVMLTVRDGDKLRFTGTKDMGGMFGVFQYRGWATPEAYYSTYTSNDDQGTFHMTRPR